VALSGVVLVALTAKPAPALSRYVEPGAAEIEAAMLRSGLSPQTLLAAGLDAQAVGLTASLGRGHLAENWLPFRAAETRLDAARDACETLERKVRQGVAKGEEESQFAAAQAELAAAELDYQAGAGALRSAALQGASGAQREAFDRILGGVPRDLPVQYAVVERADAEWVHLRDALANLRISAQLGEEPDPECVSSVNKANADPAVAAAAAGLQSLPAAEEAWNLALGN
jgi:hypothetical protein